MKRSPIRGYQSVRTKREKRKKPCEGCGAAVIGHRLSRADDVLDKAGNATFKSIIARAFARGRAEDGVRGAEEGKEGVRT